MEKMLSIFRHEVVTLLGRFSFWFGVLGVPLIAFLIISGIGYINRSQGTEGGSASASPFAGVQQLFTPPENPLPQGFIDQAGLIEHYPAGYDRAQLIRYSDPAAARKDMDANKISAYYLIPADYIQAGKIFAYMPDYNIVTSQKNLEVLRNLIDFNLLKGDAHLARLVNYPLQGLEEENLAPKTSAAARDQNDTLTFLLPYGVMMLFFITIMGSSTLLLNSIAKEKENRIMEVLMISATPHQLLLGKILGLGVVGLIQVGIWGVSSYALLRLSGQTFNLSEAFMLHPSILAWGVVYFVLGFLVYATLMAGVGALVPNLREASQATFIITLPLMIPLFILSALIGSPNGTLAVVLSIFPLTAPTTMMMRLAAADVPLWQLALSVTLLAGASFLIVRMVAGMFRAQTIMSGQTFNLKRLFLALAGRG